MRIYLKGRQRRRTSQHDIGADFVVGTIGTEIDASLFGFPAAQHSYQFIIQASLVSLGLSAFNFDGCSFFAKSLQALVDRNRNPHRESRVYNRGLECIRIFKIVLAGVGEALNVERRRLTARATTVGVDGIGPLQHLDRLVRYSTAGRSRRSSNIGVGGSLLLGKDRGSSAKIQADRHRKTSLAKGLG